MKRFSLPDKGTLTYLARSDWGAGLLRRGERIDSDRFKALVLHQTPDLPAAMGIKLPASTTDTGEAERFMRRLQEIRPDLGSEVPYSWVILRGHTSNDAIVCEGRGPLITGAHTAGMNSKRYGVAVAQNTDDEPMTAGQVQAFRWIGRTYLTDANLEATQGHSDFSNVSSLNRTECPGNNGRAMLPHLQPPFAATSLTQTVTSDIDVNLKRGDTGPKVENWQRILLAMGFELPEFGDDGDFGEETETATKESELAMGLTPDGVVSVEQARLAMNVIAQQTAPSPRPDPPVITDIALARGHVVGALEDVNQIRARLNAALQVLEV